MFDSKGIPEPLSISIAPVISPSAAPVTFPEISIKTFLEDIDFTL
ncbi:hypothetical protein [Tenacibaculum ascidiaceicola]